MSCASGLAVSPEAYAGCLCPDCIDESRKRADLAGHHWQRISEGPPPILRCAWCNKETTPLKPPPARDVPSECCYPDPWDSPKISTLSKRARNYLRRAHGARSAAHCAPTPEAVRANFDAYGHRLSLEVMRWAGLDVSGLEVQTAKQPDLSARAHHALDALAIETPHEYEESREEAKKLPNVGRRTIAELDHWASLELAEEGRILAARLEDIERGGKVTARERAILVEAYRAIFLGVPRAT